MTEAQQIISNQLEINLKLHEIQAEFEDTKKKSKSVKSLLNSNKKHFKLKNLATKDSAQAFIKVLQAVNVAEKSDILNVLKEKSFQEIMPQIMDMIGASNNPKAHLAAYEIHTNPFKSTDSGLFERYFLALTQAKTVPASILEMFTEIATNPAKIANLKTSETLILSLATIAKKSGNDKLNLQMVKFMVQSILECKNEKCYQMYLRALKNSQSVTVIPILFKLVESPEMDKKSAVIALETLKSFDSNILKNKIKHLDQRLLTIAKDPSKSLSLKSTAIELLLVNFPLSQNIEEVLKILKSEKNKELTSIVLQIWITLAETNTELKVLLR